MADLSKVLAFIEQSNDADALRTIIKNARIHGEHAVGVAAFRKLVSIVPSERPGTVEHDFWQMVNAFEHVLSMERGETTRLSRTRQKVKRVGVVETLKSWALGDGETAGFRMLLEREMPEYTGEAIVLRHADRFEPDVVTAARRRLAQAGVNVAMLARDGDNPPPAATANAS